MIDSNNNRLFRRFSLGDIKKAFFPDGEGFVHEVHEKAKPRTRHNTGSAVRNYPNEAKYFLQACKTRFMKIHFVAIKNSFILS